MKNRFIPQMEPWFGDEERQAIDAYMRENGWVTEFKKTQEFEKVLAEYIDTKYCIVVNNGTISLTLAAIAANIEAGDEVIVPNYTMIATPNSIKMFGGTPVFVDVEPETLCLDINLVEKAITNKTKAIILVLANGRYPVSGIKAFEDLAKKYNLVLLEDAAQSLGSLYPDGRHQGSVGLVGSFSFSTPKIISTGQGGALVTNDDDVAFKLKRLKDFGRSGGGLDIHDSIGYNFKFTDLQALIGLEQMKKIDWRIFRKKEMFEIYKSKLTVCASVKFFKQDTKLTAPWFIDVLVEDKQALMEYLNAKGIGTRVMYPPINKQGAYGITGNHPISNLVGEKGLWLPSAAQLSNEEIDFICDNILHFYDN